jgi:hypothetical protein
MFIVDGLHRVFAAPEQRNVLRRTLVYTLRSAGAVILGSVPGL